MANKQKTCTLCAGTGNTTNVFKSSVTCPVCNGTGKVDSIKKENTDTDTNKAE